MRLLRVEALFSIFEFFSILPFLSLLSPRLLLLLLLLRRMSCPYLLAAVFGLGYHRDFIPVTICVTGILFDYVLHNELASFTNYLVASIYLRLYSLLYVRGV